MSSIKAERHNSERGWSEARWVKAARLSAEPCAALPLPCEVDFSERVEWSRYYRLPLPLYPNRHWPLSSEIRARKDSVFALPFIPFLNWNGKLRSKSKVNLYSWLLRRVFRLWIFKGRRIWFFVSSFNRSFYFETLRYSLSLYTKIFLCYFLANSSIENLPMVTFFNWWQNWNSVVHHAQIDFSPRTVNL